MTDKLLLNLLTLGLLFSTPCFSMDENGEGPFAIGAVQRPVDRCEVFTTLHQFYMRQLSPNADKGFFDVVKKLGKLMAPDERDQLTRRGGMSRIGVDTSPLFRLIWEDADQSLPLTETDQVLLRKALGDAVDSKGNLLRDLFDNLNRTAQPSQPGAFSQGTQSEEHTLEVLADLLRQLNGQLALILGDAPGS